MIRLVHGDCLDVLPTLAAGSVGAVVTDPPWGVDADTDYTRFIGGRSDSNDYGRRVDGDATPFDPAPWLGFPLVAFWGAHCFCDRLPPTGRWLVWLKRREGQEGRYLSDAELCWVKKARWPRRAPGVYVKRLAWRGFDRECGRGAVLHPTQKPVKLMEWTMEMAGVPEGATVLDPYMGCGSTGVACARTGRHFIGVEKDPGHFAVAQRRLAAAQAETPLFAEAE